MSKTVEHIHWPDAPDMWMPYAPAIKVRGGTTVYLAGVTAAPVYHHHPHRPEEFDAMPRDMESDRNARRSADASGPDQKSRLIVVSSSRPESSGTMIRRSVHSGLRRSSLPASWNAAT